MFVLTHGHLEVPIYYFACRMGMGAKKVELGPFGGSCTRGITLSAKPCSGEFPTRIHVTLSHGCVSMYLSSAAWSSSLLTYCVIR